MKHKFLAPLQAAIVCFIISAPGLASAQDIASRTLTDKIHRGNGVINLLKNISGNELSKYFNATGGLLLLAADANETNAGNENNSSIGVAIKQAQLSISTTEGDFTFSDFYTSTSSMLRQQGSTASGEYYTLFGQNGSGQITSSTDFNLAQFDDVMWFENIAFSGTVTRAELRISLLNTPTSQATAAETFFDFSGGFEDFALLSNADAVQLEEANIGMEAAPTGLPVTTKTTSTEAIATATGEPVTSPNDNVVAAPAAPAPPWLYIAAFAGLLLLKPRKPSPSASA